MAEADPKKQQMEYILIGLLVLVAAFIGMSRFKKKDKDDEVFSRKKFDERWEEVEILEKKVPKEETGVSYAAYSERSPFKSPFEREEVKETGEDIVLPAMDFQGMVWSSTRPQAIINSKVYDIGDIIEIGEGESAENIEVKDIDKQGVHLKYKWKEFVVRPK